MSAKVARLKIRLFLEGVEVPVIAVQVQAQSNSPAVAAIQIPAAVEAVRFLPRTLVHVYFYDFYESANPLISTRGPAPLKDQKNPSVYEQKLLEGVDIDDEQRNERYKLLFVGELVGWQYVKSASQRAIILQCQDLSNYWDYAQQWENTDLFGPGYKAMFSGGSTNMFTDFLSSKDEEIVKALLTPSVQYPSLKGLLGGIIHLLESIGGSYYGDKQFGGQNIFYSLAELRLHTTQMITAYDKDDTANRLLNANGYESLFGRILGNLGDQVSFRQAINALMGVIFHETYPIPSPRYVPGTNGTVSGVRRKKMKDDPKLAFIPAGASLVETGIAQVKDAIETATSSSARAQISLQLAQQRKFLSELHSKSKALKAQDAPGIFSTVSSILGKVISKLSSWQPQKSKKVEAEIITLLDEATQNIKRAVRLEKVESNPTKAIPARLNSHIFRPDVWFTSPPRCNVLFPDHVTQVSYARAFMQEPTRLLLKTNDAFFGEDELFDQFYFAPKAITTGSEKAELQQLLSGELMSHELFTGILPVFEKMAETNIFAVRSGAVDGKMPKIGLAQRTANFLYFKYRFASRQMTVSSRFNPYVAPGFPGLIIDKYVDLQKLEEYRALVESKTGKAPALRDLLGTHYLGNFAGVTHVVDQGTGGRTEISCTYARDYNESVEFLGAIEKDQTVQKKIGDAQRVSVVAALTPPPLGALGPNYGIITKVEEYTEAYVSADSPPEVTLPLYRGARRAGKNEFQTRVLVGSQKPAQEFGAEVVALVGSPYQKVLFRAYRVTEDVPRYRKEVVDLPAEEYIRPGWYGDAWNTQNVGKVYDAFFGVGSITDPTQIADPQGASTGSPLGEADDGLLRGFGLQQSGFEDDPATTAFDADRKFAPAVLTLQSKASIAQAVEFLVQTYSYIKQGGLDPDAFIGAYTWRPIASLSDMFGSSDLEFSSDGLQVLRGIEGFHSRAFGPYENLFGLVTPEVELVLDTKVANKAAQRNDVRKRRYDLVVAYLTAIQFSRALLG